MTNIGLKFRCKKTNNIYKCIFYDNQNDRYTLQFGDPRGAHWTLTIHAKDLINNYTRVDENEKDLFDFLNGGWEPNLPVGQSNNSNTECIHDWKKYVGFKETYEFCNKCDKKRSWEP